MFQYTGDVALMALWFQVWPSDAPGPSSGDFARALLSPRTGGGHPLCPPEGVSCPHSALLDVRLGVNLSRCCVVSEGVVCSPPHGLFQDSQSSGAASPGGHTVQAGVGGGR